MPDLTSPSTPQPASMAMSETIVPALSLSKSNEAPTVSLPGSRASTLGIPTVPRAQRSQSSLRRAHTVTQAGATRRNERTVVNRPKKEQTASLLRVKNSTEVLRQRSLKRTKVPLGPDISLGVREGTHFTVANVGNNGKLYLR
jgi:hypothetical protein